MRVEMIEAQLYILADTIAAVILAAAFAAGYFYDRKLTAFIWWAGFFALVALSLATIVADTDIVPVWPKAITWLALLGATAVAACALCREGSIDRTPRATIIASFGLFVLIAAALIILNPPNMAWVLIGPVPALIVVSVSAWRVFGRAQMKPMDWVTGCALVTGSVLIFGRSLWFASLDASVAANAAGTSGGVDMTQVPPEQPLFVSLMTTLVLLGLAISAVMRAAFDAIEGMRERSTTDALSGLLNRASFDELAFAASARRTAGGLSVAVFDIDHFKQVNDTSGHPAGDRVIAALGSIISEATTDAQIAGRIGGEEFAVVLPGSNLGAARLFAEAVRTRFSACDFGSEIPWTVTLSCGVATQGDGEPFHALMARADQALYAAKRAGRDRVLTATKGPALAHAEVKAEARLA